jgi:hypothetical protein
MKVGETSRALRKFDSAKEAGRRRDLKSIGSGSRG